MIKGYTFMDIFIWNEAFVQTVLAIDIDIFVSLYLIDVRIEE